MNMLNKPKPLNCKHSIASDHKPSVCTDHWAFYEDCPNAKKKYIGPYEKEWRDRYDTIPKTYKDIATSKVCLPKLPTAANTSTSERRNHIYTRFTEKQHRRKDVVDRIEKMIKIQSASKKGLAIDQSPKPSCTCMTPKSSERLSFDPGDFANYSSKQIDMKLRTGDGKKEEQQIMNTDDIEAMIDVKLRNPYKTYAKPQRVNREDDQMDKKRRKSLNKKKEEEEDASTTHSGLNSAAETRLRDVVQDFCDSILDLGGEEANIDATTVNCLFTSGYDTTPAMSAPVMLVKQSELPPGLKEIMGGSTQISPGEGKKEAPRTSKAVFEKKVKANRNGFKYGAWYLNPKTWKRVKKDVQLQDPKTIKWEATMTDLDVRKREVAEELSSLHILKAFSEFIRYKNVRLPEFVLEAERFSQEKEMKERQKVEAEARARQEYLMKNTWS